MSGINLGDLPSWILVILMGFGLRFAGNNGILQGTQALGSLLVIAGLSLGAFYYYNDIGNKIR